MKAQVAYLTSPAPNAYVLHAQPEGWSEPMQFELRDDQLKNIVAAYLALKKQTVQNRVPASLTRKNANERAADRAQQRA